MRQVWPAVVAACLGGIVGACVREAVVRDARAQEGAPATVQYKVVGASFGPDGYQQDLNNFALQGWRYVGSVQNHLVLERAR